MTGGILKLIAVISMFIDHLAVALRLGGFLETGKLYQAMRIIGRAAFPIYGLLLAVGVMHTRSRRKYFLRLFVFALISELPFDLALRGRLLVWDHQNVYFTLLLGFFIMCVIRWGSRLPGYKRYLGWGAAIALSAGFALLSQKVLWFDYRASGVIMLTVIGFLVAPLEEIRNWVPWENLVRCFFVAAAVLAMTPFTSGTEYYALFSLIPIAFYNGKRGYTNEAIKYAFYAFYPAHLMLLWLLFVLPAVGFRL